MSIKCSFSSPQDLHGRNSKGPYNIISHDSIGIHHFPCIALVYAVFQIYFIDIICDKGNNVRSFILLAYWDTYTKKYFLLNVGLVAPKMQVTLNHEYLDPEVCTHTKFSLIWKGKSRRSWKYHIFKTCLYNIIAFWLLL